MDATLGGILAQVEMVPYKFVTIRALQDLESMIFMENM